MEQNIIFLDIDGVVNSTASTLAKIGPGMLSSPLVQALERMHGLPYGAHYALQTVDPVAVGLINMLIKEADAYLVLSSTHRMHFRSSTTQYGSERHLEILRLYLTAMGFTVPDKFSVTPILQRPRGEEVAEWLLTHSINGAEVPHAILDDSRDFADTQPLVRVDGHLGFSMADYTCARRMLDMPAASSIIF